MTYDDERAVRDRLDDVARSAPPLSFGPGDLVRRGRQRRRRRQGAVVTASVAALALVVAVPAVALPDRGRTGTPAAGASARPEPTMADGTRRPGAIPGVSAARAGSIALGCGQAYGGDIGHVNPTPEPGETQGPLVRDAVRLYNVVTDGAGSHALLYGPGVALTCDFRGSQFNAGGYSGGNPVSLQWLPGPFSIDLDSGDETGGTVAGRVTSAVGQVEVRMGGRRTRVAPVNGTYLVRIAGSGTGEGLQVTAYGRNGTAMETRAPGDIECYTSPDGTVVIQGSDRTTNCRRATPWR